MLTENETRYYISSLPLLVKQFTHKDSIAMKRRGCGWNENFMLEVLTGSNAIVAAGPDRYFESASVKLALRTAKWSSPENTR